MSLPCVKTSNTSCPPPLLLLKSTLKRSWSDVCICECECVCECENICKCVAPAVKPRQRFKSPRADTQGWEAVSTTQPLAAEEVTLIMSCQCLEIRVSTAISYPACVCVCACICVCVLWVLWVWDRVGEGKQRSYSGRNIIYCAVSFGERERERIPPVLLTLFFCFYLSGVGWLSTLSLFFFSAIPCFTLIQSNVFVAGSCSGYKQSYAVCHRASRFSVYFCRSCWSEWVFPHFLKASADPMHQIGIGND